LLWQKKVNVITWDTEAEEFKIILFKKLTWSNKPLLWHNTEVTWPGILWCPGTQSDDTCKLRQYPSN